MKNPLKLLLFLLSNTKTITLYNKTKEVVAITDYHGIITDKTVKAGGKIDIDPKEYDGNDCRGGRLPLLMIVCGGSPLKLPEGHFLIPGEEFFSTCFKTVSIDQPNDQNSTGVVNYEVKFQAHRAHREVTANTLKFSRDPVLDHDNGWSVQCINGTPMTLDPSELFASNIVQDPETLFFYIALLTVWPGTFGKGDLEKTVGVVYDLMVQAKKYSVNRPEGAVDEVMKNVAVLNKLCAAKVEWYRPFFPWMVEKIPPVAVDQENLKKFETMINPRLNSFLGRSS